MAIPISIFLANVAQIESEKPSYKLGGDGRNGICDCIGLIIGAVRRSGGKWTGSHGSNWAARNAVDWNGSGETAEPGDLVFKYHAPGEAAYALPDSYQGHPDQLDYYHVGVIISVTPLVIKHCTSWSGGSGIKTDTAWGRWLKVGKLKLLSSDIEEETPVGKVAYIKLPSTSNVFHRINPNSASKWYARIPGGEAVEVTGEKNGWAEVAYNGKLGYVKADFLTDTPPDNASPAPVVASSDTRDILAAIMEHLDQAQAGIRQLEGNL